MTRISVGIPVIVEGKYDKIKLESVIDAHIVTTDGFGLFKDNEKRKYITRLASKSGVIVLTDSDGGGLVIRNYINSVLPKDKIHHIYIPQIEGKEKRKKTASKEGYLGVEGIDADMLRKLFSPFSGGEIKTGISREITKADLYADGLSGGENSEEKRKALLKKAELPTNLSSNALLSALNFLFSYDEYKAFLN